MLKIGITGGIGSGKSVICRIFSQLGIAVYDADRAAKRLIDSDGTLKWQIKKEFGDTIFDMQNNLKRKELAGIVFINPDALQKLNQLIHPVVKKDFDKWVLQRQHLPYIIKEAAILFESGANEGLDYVIVVSAPEKLRMQRVMKRDEISEEKVKARSMNQMSEEEKIKRSDFVISNDEIQLVIPQVVALHNKFLSLKK